MNDDWAVVSAAAANHCKKSSRTISRGVSRATLSTPFLSPRRQVQGRDRPRKGRPVYRDPQMAVTDGEIEAEATGRAATRARCCRPARREPPQAPPGAGLIGAAVRGAVGPELARRPFGHRCQSSPWLASTCGFDRVCCLWGTVPPRGGGQPLHPIYHPKAAAVALAGVFHVGKRRAERRRGGPPTAETTVSRAAHLPSRLCRFSTLSDRA